jgi:hypothetical protein
MKKLYLMFIVLVVFLSVVLSACSSPADVASQNVSREADNFQVVRRIVFYNGVTGDYILTIEGKCSLGNYDPAGSLSVICKTDDGTFIKHFLGLSDNVTYFAEQLVGVDVNAYHYNVYFRPETIIPSIKWDSQRLPANQ